MKREQIFHSKRLSFWSRLRREGRALSGLRLASCGQIGRTRKTQKRTISYSFGNILPMLRTQGFFGNFEFAYGEQSRRKSIRFYCADRHCGAVFGASCLSIARMELPVSSKEECHRRVGPVELLFALVSQLEMVVSKGFYLKGLLVNATSRLNASRFVELALCNLLYYLDFYRPCYYLRAGVDDVSRFEAVAAEMGVRCNLGGRRRLVAAHAVGMSPKRGRSNASRMRSKTTTKGFAIAKGGWWRGDP